MARGALERKPPRLPPDKFAKRKAELAEAALQTLADLGYARTSLREIAQNSRFSHGVLHYYFSDKMDLIAYCVRDYKAKCVKRYDQIVDDATSYSELVDKFMTAMAKTLRDNAQMHRLWYDLRSQALFEDCFRSDVQEIDKSLEDMIWRIVSRAFELRGMQPTLSSPLIYATFDGLFQSALLRYLAGDSKAIADMQSNMIKFLEALGVVAKRGSTFGRAPSREQNLRRSVNRNNARPA
jgi:AcrR family transcriptional regulator